MIPEEVQQYVTNLVRLPVDQDPVLRDMEKRAREPRFPIIGAEVGALLEVVTRARSARRVFEVGSGFGYSAWFFARGTGDAGEVHLTDLDPKNLDLARDYLARAGYKTTFRFHAGDAMTALEREIARAPFDVYLVDADKRRYPDYWAVIRPRMRPGDIVIADNLLWGGDVADPKVQDEDTNGLRRFARLAAEDPGVRFTLLPIRDGVGLAVRV